MNKKKLFGVGIPVAFDDTSKSFGNYLIPVTSCNEVASLTSNCRKKITDNGPVALWIKVVAI